MQPTDDELIAFLKESPARSLKDICGKFALPYCKTDSSYTPEAKAVRNQLQRLRRAYRIRTDQGSRWKVC